MKQKSCRFEKDVMIAGRLKRWTTDLRSHASTCPVCSETLHVSNWMQAWSSEHKSIKLPSHKLIWLKAQYARRQERFSMIDILALGSLSVIGITGLIGLLVWQFPHLFSGIIDMTGRSLRNLGNLFSYSTSITITIAVVIMVWILTRDSLTVKH